MEGPQGRLTASNGRAEIRRPNRDTARVRSIRPCQWLLVSHRANPGWAGRIAIAPVISIEAEPAGDTGETINRLITVTDHPPLESPMLELTEWQN